MTSDDCYIFRDSLAKDLYNKLFNWLVKRLNFTTVPSEFLTKGEIKIDEIINDSKYFHIGLLDIFGFEIFKINSLEQFCINFTNEKLQQLYIAYVFKGEEKEFINEGLKDFLCELRFRDN
jgi:myosin heavy subunit